MDFDAKLDAYARVLANAGAMVCEGDRVVISSVPTVALDLALPLARRIGERSFEAGAHYVHLDLLDDEIVRSRYLAADPASLDTVPRWRSEESRHIVNDERLVQIVLMSHNPALFDGVEPDRTIDVESDFAHASGSLRKNRSTARIKWTVGAVPSVATAGKAFPELSPTDAVDAYWNVIFECCRADADDPVGFWIDKRQRLIAAARDLTDKGYRSLHLEGPGTDLMIELNPRARWASAAFTHASSGVEFLAAIPIEALHTMPLSYGVEGTVSSSMPIVYQGAVIDDFRLTFERGKVVVATAATGADALRLMLATDPGMSRLGEIALVSERSPLVKLGRPMYNALYDENAACSMALGNAILSLIDGTEAMSEAELDKLGVNTSRGHVDFMYGRDDMEIRGVLENGTSEPIERDW